MADQSTLPDPGHPGRAGIDPHRAVLHRDDRIGDAERKVVVGMDTALGFGLQHAVIGLQPRGIFVHVHRTATVGDIDALGAIAFHQQRLARQGFRAGHMAHHQEARNVHAQVAGGLNMLFRNIRLGLGLETIRRIEKAAVGHAHIFEQDAEIGLIDTKLRLNSLRGQTGLAAHDPPALILPVPRMVTYRIKTGQGSHRLFTKVGMQLEAYCSGIGKVLLAHLPAAERAAYLASGPFVPLTARTIVDPEELALELERVADQGVAIDDGEIAEGLVCLAVPVHAPDGSVPIAISVSRFETDRPAIDRTRILALLKEAAAEIEFAAFADHPRSVRMSGSQQQRSPGKL